jgi:hypothetical protein
MTGLTRIITCIWMISYRIYGVVSNFLEVTDCVNIGAVPPSVSVPKTEGDEFDGVGIPAEHEMIIDITKNKPVRQLNCSKMDGKVCINLDFRHLYAPGY